MDRQSKTADYIQQTIERNSEFIQLLNTPLNDDLLAMIQLLKQNNAKINYCCTDDQHEMAELGEGHKLYPLDTSPLACICS